MDKDPFLRSIFKNPLYFFEYSPDVPKKETKNLDIYNKNKKYYMKINTYRNKSSRDMNKDPISQRRIRIPITDIKY